MTVSVKTKKMEGPTLNSRKNGLWSSAFHRLSKNTMAMIGLGIVVFMILVAIFADVIAPYAYDEQHLQYSNVGPCAMFPFGTDKYGRCNLSRVIYGARTSLGIGFSAVIIGAVIGGVIGAIAGYYSGIADNILMRIIDVILSVPPMLLAISIAAMMGTGLINTIVAISIGCIGEFARMTRASILPVRDQEYIEAVRTVSASDWRIITKHILPNILAPFIVSFTLKLASCLLGAAGLSFVGLGVSAPQAEWGSMISAGRGVIRSQWWLTVFPGLAAALTVYGFNLLGDGLRDALDPKLKDRG